MIAYRDATPADAAALHALFNSTDENLSLLMFGGYD